VNLYRKLSSQHGITLVELLVAVTLAIILMSGLVLMFTAQKTTYKMQEGVSLIQEAGRYAVNRMRSDYRKAGYGGCLSPQSTPIVHNIVTNPPDYLEAIKEGEPVSGQDDVSSVTVGGRDVLDGTDVLEIRGPLSSSIAYVTGKVFVHEDIEVSGISTNFAANEYLMIADCSGAEIFRATAVTTTAGPPPVTTIGHDASLNTQGTLTRKFGADAVVMELFIYSYFVGDTGRTRNGQPVLALYREDGSNNPQELIEGVEDMQLTYGLDTDGDALADTFEDADGVTDWSQVVSVEVSMLLNSVDGSAQERADYVYLPDSSTPITPTDPDDYRMRQEFSSVIQLRNAGL
jgi:type IV pilus assembly protein PilW